MPSSRTKPKPLSDTEIQHIADEVSAGRPPMVWFTAAAVGVDEGRSGKVVALGDPADGDYLQVRPTGSKDVLSFSPIEVTLTKPSRDRTTGAQPSSRKETPVTQAPPAPRTESQPAKPAAPAKAAVSAKPAATATADTKSAAKPAAPAAKSAKPAGAARKSKAPEVTVTLSGSADGTWTVEVVSGKKRTVRGLPVSSGAVAQATKLLHPEVADVVAGVLEAARDAQQERVQQLQAELEEAKRLLEELSD
ncbi:DUF6319 family protein [Nocardia paucivorans]|uniref:DUF6319 family protein n=1 Tax=Nocardia paucivorans TaxID=114259 RepID=UPI0002DE3866|nr:DUF6319 family protein [Nocardia paucivorans]